jgi:hypothetical protein
MNMQRCYLLVVIVGFAAATPALGQTVAPAAIPDFSGIWWHPSLPGFEPPATGPGPVSNRSRRNGVSDYYQLVGDYTNPNTTRRIQRFRQRTSRISEAAMNAA